MCSLGSIDKLFKTTHLRLLFAKLKILLSFAASLVAGNLLLRNIGHINGQIRLSLKRKAIILVVLILAQLLLQLLVHALLTDKQECKKAAHMLRCRF